MCDGKMGELHQQKKAKGIERKNIAEDLDMDEWIENKLVDWNAIFIGIYQVIHFRPKLDILISILCWLCYWPERRKRNLTYTVFVFNTNRLDIQINALGIQIRFECNTSIYYRFRSL